MENKKIVLIGGPCSGKTKSIKLFKKELEKEYFNVNIIPETPTILFQLGYVPNDNINVFDFQNLLFKIQLIKEYNQEGITICDRGLLDGEVYIGEDKFNKILEFNHISKDTILSTYNFAVYFRSIVYDDPGRFQLERPYEQIPKAIDRDKEAKRIWKDIILGDEIDNSISFEEKQIKLLSLLMRYLDNSKSKSLRYYYDESYIDFYIEALKN